MNPSVIKYWKNGKWSTSKRVFYSEDEVTEWYKHNRHRIDGLSIVISVEAAADKSRWC